MVISHSRKGFKSAEEVQAFLTRNAGISKEKVDKKKLYEALKAGQEVEGASLKINESLRIK